MAKAIVLGTAQDGGLPHAGCRCERCGTARADPDRARRIACLGLVDRGRGFLVDATPDLPRQVLALPALSGILLTHAHMGHVAGLLWLGREAMAVRGLPVWLGPRLADHLERNEPWATLVRDGFLAPKILVPNETIQLSPQLSARAIPVPHRDEWSETYAWRISGRRRTLLWLPDIDRFGDLALRGFLQGVDLAFLDGTFWSDAELPGRDLTEIPHPRIRNTVALLAEIQPAGAVSFVHLNHSNPCLDPSSPESGELAELWADAGLRPTGATPIAAEDETHEV